MGSRLPCLNSLVTAVVRLFGSIFIRFAVEVNSFEIDERRQMDKVSGRSHLPYEIGVRTAFTS